MPKENQNAYGGPIVAPVRVGESWREYIKRLRAEPELGPSQIAGIMCASVLIEKNPEEPVDRRMLLALSDKLMKQPSFRALVREPEALELARAGKGTDLIVRMGEIKRQRLKETGAYQRDPSVVQEDAVFLKAAQRSMKDSFAACSPRQRERESKLYLEMMKRMEHARSLAEQGIPLDGKTARELAQSVQRYNDAGGKTPGGKHQAAACREALCVLKRLMPEETFNGYCDAINRTHGAKDPTHRRYVDPKDYGDALLRGGARSARDLMLASQRQLSRGMTLDGCAAVTAIMQLSRGNPNAVIRRDALESEIKKLKTPGSAFLRAMSDPKARERYGELASGGSAVLLGKSLIRAAKAHTVRAAQWQMDQAMQASGKDGSGGASVEKLAVILAAREMAVNASASQEITNGAFKAKTEEIRSSPGFSALAAQYRRDPALRNRINAGLINGDGGKALEQEYQKVNAPQKEKTLEAPVLKKPEGE